MTHNKEWKEPKCPTCRVHVRGDSFMRNRVADSLVGNTLVSCQTSASGTQLSKRPRYVFDQGVHDDEAVGPANGAVLHATRSNGAVLHATRSSVSIEVLDTASSSEEGPVNGAAAANTEVDAMVVDTTGLLEITCMTIDQLRGELGIEPGEGDIPRVQLMKDTTRWRKDGTAAVCRWQGRICDMQQHLDNRCRTTTKPCPFPNCKGDPLHKHADEHRITCGARVMTCGACLGEHTAALLQEHFNMCPQKIVKCPNELCPVSRMRGVINLHRAECPFERIKCHFQPCDQVRLRCMDMKDHLARDHSDELFNAVLRMASMQARLDTFASEERLHSTGHGTKKVFNWAIPTGFGLYKTLSEAYDFGDGYSATAILRANNVGDPQDTLYIGFSLVLPRIVDRHPDHLDKFVAKLAIMWQDDMQYCTVKVFGTPTIPHEHNFLQDPSFGQHFEVADWMRDECERSDGSIRARVELELFKH